VAEFIGDGRSKNMSNTELLIAIDKQFPGLRARTLIAAHFIDQAGRRQGRAQ
jgi:hypothetical protein